MRSGLSQFRLFHIPIIHYSISTSSASSVSAATSAADGGIGSSPVWIPCEPGEGIAIHGCDHLYHGGIPIRSGQVSPYADHLPDLPSKGFFAAHMAPPEDTRYSIPYKTGKGKMKMSLWLKRACAQPWCPELAAGGKDCDWRCVLQLVSIQLGKY